MDWNFRIVGNAFEGLQHIADQAKRTIMAAVNKSAHKVQARAKINVHQKLNTTGLSKGILSRSITVISRPIALEAAIGPTVIYGRIHEFGGVIKPIKGEFLWFRVPVSQAISFTKAGKVKPGAIEMSGLIHVRQVTIPPRPYLNPALEASKPDIDEIFREELSGLIASAPKLLRMG